MVMDILEDIIMVGMVIKDMAIKDMDKVIIIKDILKELDITMVGTVIKVDITLE